MAKIKWEKGYTGGIASKYQSDFEGYSESGIYKWAIKSDKEKHTLYRVKESCYVKGAIWDYRTDKYAEDGSEIGWALYEILESDCLEGLFGIADIIEKVLDLE